jgi:REP element-mobilizing transposase RayT
MAKLITEWPQFFSATNLEWKRLLEPDKYKEIIIESLKFLVDEERIRVYGFVIMINHIHLIWQMCAANNPKSVQRDFLKFTAQRIKADLSENDPALLDYFRVDAPDRQYQFWERNALSIELRSERVLLQKLRYIHQNPVKAGLCIRPEDYKYSSARFYQTGIDDWGFLSHFRS